MGLMLEGDSPGVSNLSVAQRFQNHPMDEDQKQVAATVEHKFSEVAQYINFTIADGREKSLAITALEEAKMWATKAIAKVNP